ncbi:MAG: hypothetical protein DHS80DRAFT_29234 [Piptocephalis tieghemiana]|nr:MAG: hypothetical protein DHS80DRAFT_29234 [Piptocephalis tieghemiana]
MSDIFFNLDALSQGYAAASVYPNNSTNGQQPSQQQQQRTATPLNAQTSSSSSSSSHPGGARYPHDASSHPSQQHYSPHQQQQQQQHYLSTPQSQSSPHPNTLPGMAASQGHQTHGLVSAAGGGGGGGLLLPTPSHGSPGGAGGPMDGFGKEGARGGVGGSPTTPHLSTGPQTMVTPTTATPTTSHGIVPTLQNIVATVNLDCRLDLKTIALHARNAEYNPKRFAAVIMRIRDPKTTALIFASGKMVVTGAKSEDDSKLAARKYARIVQKLGFAARFTDFKIQNIVGSCDVKFPIRLEGLAYAHGSYSSYEPELFPGLIYRMVQPKIVLLIFVSGKIVLTGAKVREEIYRAFDNIYPTLEEFRKP